MDLRRHALFYKYVRRTVCENEVVLGKGVTMKYMIRVCLYLTLCLSFCMSAGQLHGQVVYTITGFANNLGLEMGRVSEVASGETYVAEFEIDLAVADSDTEPGRGVYTGAIVSSSIEFSGGYESQVDFAGGEVTVLQDSAGGGIFLKDLAGDGNIVVFDLNNPFDSDALLTDPATEFDGSPESLYLLMEPTGSIVSFSDVAVESRISTRSAPITTGPMTFSVSLAVSEIEPVLLGDTDRNRVINFADISPFIAVLISGQFQVEADIDQNGEVNFSDISPFNGSTEL